MARKATVSTNPSMNDYETEQDVSALQRAQEVKGDPKRHAKAKAHAKKKLAEHAKKGAALAAVAGSGTVAKASKKFNKTRFADLAYTK